MDIFDIEKKKYSKRINNMTICAILAVFLLLCVAVLIMLKKININPSFVGEYPIRGVDVSHYQGEIEWEQFREQGIDFAFIKATEGSSFDSPASSQRSTLLPRWEI